MRNLSGPSSANTTQRRSVASPQLPCRRAPAVALRVRGGVRPVVGVQLLVPSCRRLARAPAHTNQYNLHFAAAAGAPGLTRPSLSLLADLTLRQCHGRAGEWCGDEIGEQVSMSRVAAHAIHVPWAGDKLRRASNTKGDAPAARREERVWVAREGAKRRRRGKTPSGVQRSPGRQERILHLRAGSARLQPTGVSSGKIGQPKSHGVWRELRTLGSRSPG